MVHNLLLDWKCNGSDETLSAGGRQSVFLLVGLPLQQTEQFYDAMQVTLYTLRLEYKDYINA